LSDRFSRAGLRALDHAFDLGVGVNPIQFNRGVLLREDSKDFVGKGLTDSCNPVEIKDHGPE
jgi:hypothetical protein